MGKVKEFLFKNTSTRQTVLKNAFWLSAGQIGSRVLRAFIIIYAARILGAAEYGVFSYVLGLAGFFSIFSDIGLTPILTREVSQKPERAGNYFSTTFVLKTGLLLATALLVIFVAPHFTDIQAAQALVPFAALLIIFDNIREFCAGFFRGKEKMELEALLVIATNVAITVFGFIILYRYATAGALTLTYILSASTGAIVGIFVLRKQFAKLFSAFRRALVSPILRSALPIAMLSVVGAFMLNIDIIMLGIYRAAESVGLYSAGQKVVQILYTLPAILATTLYPVFSRFVSTKNKEGKRKSIERGLAATVLIAAPLAIGGFILAKQILFFLYGAEYVPATLTFQLLILTPLLVFPGTLLNNFVVAHDAQKLLIPYATAASIGNVALDALLIPTYGIAGCAFATILVSVIYNGGAYRIANTLGTFTLARHTKKIATATVAMGVVTATLNALGIHVLVTIGISALIYVGLLYLMREQTLVEIKSVLPM